MGEELLGGRYELRGLIGSGGMARVYRAYDRTLKREVAVKTLVGDTLEEAQSVERFRREARAAANLSHPNIVGIYDWGETASNGAYGHPSYYMVMELIPGENLKQIIDARGPLPESEALDIAAQVAAALQAAHDHGVIHRDVKPQNILIGSSGQVKMTDFGIARAAGLTQLTATDAICGTPYYLSPEQAQRQALDNRSDVYGLGVVLYEMLTGTELFHGSPLEVAMRHVREEAPSPRALQPPVSAATETIVRKALAKKPADRFQSAGDMRTALRQARNRLALAEPLPPPAAAAVRPRRAPGTAGLTTQWRMRQPEAQPFRRKDGSLANPWWRVIPVILLVALFTGALAFLNSRNGGSSHGKKPVAAQPAATRTPQPTSTPKPKPTATHVVAAAAHPTATTAPTPVPTPVPTSAPTSVPATTSPTGGVAVVSSSAGSPVAAVKSFYQLVSAHDFADAAALWSANMLAAYPPAANINDRFRDTQSIIVESYKVDSIDRSGGNAVVSVQLLETKTSGAQQTLDGAWSLVLTPSGWLLDSPSFTQASEYLRHAPPPHPSHPDQGHGKGHDKSEKPAKSEKRAKPGKGQNAGEGE